MKKLNESVVVVAILFFVFVFTGCGLYNYGTSGVQTSYANPQWAPPYYAGARYYYLPDAECYYDLSSREFIYLERGQWIYSQNMPSIYADFDLNNSFAIVLNVNVYRPWMHHQYYVSHYPRYYYRDYYDHSNIPYVRGFNENGRKAIYWKENERSRARSWDNQNQRNDRGFKYTKDDRQQQRNTDNERRGENGTVSRNTRSDRTSDKASGQKTTRRTESTNNDDRSTRGDNQNTTRQQRAKTPEAEKPRSTNYYGRTIGNPVKVEKQMQDKKETKTNTRTKTETKKETKSTGRR